MNRDDQGARAQVVTHSTPRLQLRTGAWYGDQLLQLDLPDSWHLIEHRPGPIKPLTAGELQAALRHPSGCVPLSELAEGKQRVVILIDDLTRPTPVGQIVPYLLADLESAGVHRSQVTVLMAGGTHRPATPEQVARKVGRSADGCAVVAHDSTAGCVRIGRSSRGTPVIVNRLVAEADLLIGVGGVYPQHSVGFGGGSKLVMGVLGRRSISALHYGHPSMAGSYNTDNAFRRDLDEIAGLVRLAFLVSVHIDHHREIVRAVAGDYRATYAEAAAFSRSAYSAPLPGAADVVIVNTYPMDVSLTFARAKGMAPLFHVAPGASRVMVAACSEGLGYHGLFPFLNGPRFQAQRDRWRALIARSPRTLAGNVTQKLRCLAQRAPAPQRPIVQAPASPRNPIHLFTPGLPAGSLPATIPGIQTTNSWGVILEAIEREQGAHDERQVVIYHAAALQCLEYSGRERTGYLTGFASG